MIESLLKNLVSTLLPIDGDTMLNINKVFMELKTVVNQLECDSAGKIGTRNDTAKKIQIAREVFIWNEFLLTENL